MKILVSNEQRDVDISALSFEEIVAALLEKEGISCDECHLSFVDEETITQLHADYFDDPTPTDCITFPIDTEDNVPYRVLGEIVVCPMTAVKYVELHGGNVMDEVTLYVVHGILHLLGYDDIEEEDQLEIRAAETRMISYLKEISIKNA